MVRMRKVERMRPDRLWSFRGRDKKNVTQIARFSLRSANSAVGPHDRRLSGIFPRPACVKGRQAVFLTYSGTLTEYGAVSAEPITSESPEAPAMTVPAVAGSPPVGID